MLNAYACGRRAAIAPIAALAIAAGPVNATGVGDGARAADAAETRTDYVVSIAGIEIGEAALILKSADDGYDAELTGGFRFLFWTGAAEARSLGARDGGELAPDAYRSRFESPSRVFVTAIDFDGEATEGSWRTEPPLTGDGFDERVPITKADLAEAKDPLSAFIIPAKSAREACARSLKVYSGVVRFDIDLAPIADAEAGAGAGEGCAGAYRPIAGHRRASDEVSRLEREGLTLSLFEIAPGYWAPAQLGFKTRFGTLAFEKRG